MFFILSIIHVILIEAFGVFILYYFGVGWIPWIISAFVLSMAQVSILIYFTYKSQMHTAIHITIYIHTIHAYTHIGTRYVQRADCVCISELCMLLYSIIWISFFYQSIIYLFSTLSSYRQVGHNMIMVIVVFSIALHSIEYFRILQPLSWRDRWPVGGMVATFHIIPNQMM